MRSKQNIKSVLSNSQYWFIGAWQNVLIVENSDTSENVRKQKNTQSPATHKYWHTRMQIFTSIDLHYK